MAGDPIIGYEGLVTIRQPGPNDIRQAFDLLADQAAKVDMRVRMMVLFAVFA